MAIAIGAGTVLISHLFKVDKSSCKNNMNAIPLDAHNLDKSYCYSELNADMRGHMGTIPVQ